MYLLLQQFSSRSNSPFSNFSSQRLTNKLCWTFKIFAIARFICWNSEIFSYCRLNVAPLGKKMHSFSSFSIPRCLVYSWNFLILFILSLSLPYLGTNTLLILQIKLFFCIPAGNNQIIVNSSLLVVTSELNILQKERILSSKVTARRLTTLFCIYTTNFFLAFKYVLFFAKILS